MTHFDLVVVGTGSGNSVVDDRFDDWQVAIVEAGTFGGTCLNVGCIPTKMYAYPAELARVPAEAARLGVDLRFDRARWREIRDRVFGRIDPIAAAGREYRVERNANVTVYEQHVRLTGPRSLETADGRQFTTDRLVLANGSRPIIPDVPGLSRETVDRPGSRLHTSDTLMRLDELPARLVIVGGGYIAAEFAHVFSAFGAEVIQVARSAGLLRTLDDEVSRRFTEHAARQWDVRLQTDLESLTDDGSGVQVRVRTPDGEATTIDADQALVCIGRAPYTEGLGVEAAGIDLRDDGRVAVDAYQRVLGGGEPLPGVWSLGDVSSPYMLKHVANHEARIVQHNLLHPDDLRAVDHRFVPAAVFTHPQLASVGLTETQAREAGHDVVTAVQDYASVAYGWAMEDETGFVKLVADRTTGDLLGAHLLGHEASMIVQPLIQAMSFGLGAREMARGQYWIHPALPEVVENALLSLSLD